jgi:hypothetical protein
MFLRLLALLVAVGLEGGMALGQIVMASSESLPSAHSPATKPKAQSRPALAQCPTAGLPAAQPSPATGHHRVTLSWKASSPSANSQNAAVGYCLYRSTKKDAPQKQPTCLQCQQINTVPIPGTSCVDDLVEDKATYYYVVTAVNAQGTASLPSNEVSALIETNEKSSPIPSTSPPTPACRASSPAQ